MGWFWTASQGSQSTQSEPESATVADMTPSERNPAQPQSSTTSPESQSRDEVADREFATLWQEIEADLRPSSTKYNRVPKQPPTPTSQSEAAKNVAAENLTLEEQLLPTTMSCRQKFDDAFYCQSFGGQFNNLYRYGGMRECSELWGDFWFCMKTRSQSGSAKDEMVRDRYKRKALKYKLGPSSEDVWKSRDKKLEFGEAFNERYEEHAGSDEEWQKMEALRRAGRVSGTT